MLTDLVCNFYRFAMSVSYSFYLILVSCLECWEAVMNSQALLDGRSIRDGEVEMNHLIQPAFPYRAAGEIHHTQHRGRITDQNRH